MAEELFSGMYEIAQRYSNALFSIGEEKNSLDEIKNDLLNIKELINESKELKDFFENPIVSVEDKVDVAQNIFASKISENVLNFVKLLIENNRFFAFSAIVFDYNKRLNSLRNIAVAKVSTCVDMDSEATERLKQKLENIFKKNISLEFNIDESIIGGVVVKIGDKVIDGSVKAKIEEMKRQII